MWEPTHTLLINVGGVGRLTKHKTPDSHRMKSEDSGVEGEGEGWPGAGLRSFGVDVRNLMMRVPWHDSIVATV